MTKDFGPGVSGYDVPEGRAWETVVYQSGKPILDKENNLLQDVDGGAAQANLRRAMPSGWLSNDFVNTSDSVGAIFAPSATANYVEIPNDILAHVNGWLVKLRHTNATGHNEVDLGASPAGVGALRTDVVLLEVWRKLISASPDTDGKSATGRIWQEGNVKTDPANDLVLNYSDDILDTNVGAETTKRVQIQYRLRVIQGVDLFAYPYALDDPIVVANTVPPDALTPDGAPTAFAYVNQSANGDPGLWIAGDGNPANTLDTVDGYMYALPLFGVFRRNTNAFARLDNHNGGVASPGPSDRPDGLFYDMIVAEDLVDLRSGVSPSGWSLSELLEKNTNFLLDNTLRSEIGTTSPSGGGYNGTTVFMANEIGVLPGDGITTGDTTAGYFAGQFDAVRRRFSDRSVFELVTVEIPAPGPGWAPGDVVVIDPTALPVYPYPAFNWASRAPADVRFLDIVRAQWVGAPGSSTAQVPLYNVTGLGAAPITPLTMTLTILPPAIPALTNEPLYVTLLVGYPTGMGLSHTPTDDFGAGSYYVNNPAQLPAAPPVSFSAFANQALDYPHREVELEYETVPLTLIVAGDTEVGGVTVYLPERAESIISVLVNAAPAAYTLDSSGIVITLAVPTIPGDTVQVDYTARRPLPQNDEQMTIYFRTAVSQTARNALLSGTLTVVPKITNKSMFALTTGSGSQDEGYPFSAAYVQTGGVFPSNLHTYSGESELSARAEVSVADFNAETGLLHLPVYIPMVANPESLEFTRGLGDVDVEGRTYFKTVPAGYIPNAYAQDLSNPDRHKDILPVLAELAADTPLGYKGQLVLILLIRYALFDETNGVFFDADLNNNTTTASVFRLKGNLLNKRQT